VKELKVRSLRSSQHYLWRRCVHLLPYLLKIRLNLS